jgi:hypothetical protein
MWPMDGDPSPVPPQVVAVAYLLALLALLVPLAVVGSTFAGIVLLQRGLRGHGLTVIVLGAACMAVAVTALR